MEFLAYLWDELDDVAGACRHVATWTADEVLSSVVPLLAAVSPVLLAGAATLLLAHRELFVVLA